MTTLQQLIDEHQSGYSLAKPFYLNQNVYEAEWQHIWKKYWLFAGTTASIPKPGDYFVYQLRNESVIIIRGDKGEVFAHHNSCRHRGSLICLEQSGHATKLMCPYHQWVYNKDGSLHKARLMPDDFNLQQHGLKPVAIELVAGLIFISLNDSPPDFEPVRKDFAPFVQPFQIDKAKVAYQKQYVLRTNWKLVAENFRECYHCGPAHPEYCSAVIGANLRESADNELLTKQQLWRSKGLATDTVNFVDDSFHFAIRYPLRPGITTYSLDGKAISKPMGDHCDHDAGVVGLVCYPNFWMDAVSDYIWTMRLTATGPNETILDLAWLVDGDAKEGVDYDVNRLVEFWKITGEQDWQLCENNFKGIETSGYEPGPYAPAEIDVAKFIDWYLGRMQAGIQETLLA
jgi:phenylpropionate dioxygenase-like ring-hydroxylating dioxygenase large terminal subunit